MITCQLRIKDGTQLGSVLNWRYPDLQGIINVVEWWQPKSGQHALTEVHSCVQSCMAAKLTAVRGEPYSASSWERQRLTQNPSCQLTQAHLFLSETQQQLGHK